MPWFLNPRAYERLPVYQNPELYYLIIKVLAALIFAVLLYRRGARGLALAGATWAFFFGLFVAFMMTMHAGVILGLRALERPSGEPFVYDFYLFSLMLLAGVLVPQGLRMIVAAPSLALRERNARRRTVYATVVVLAVGAALIPIQFFGVILTVAAVVLLILLAIIRPKPGTLKDSFDS